MSYKKQIGGFTYCSQMGDEICVYWHTRCYIGKSRIRDEYHHSKCSGCGAKFPLIKDINLH